MQKLVAGSEWGRGRRHSALALLLASGLVALSAYGAYYMPRVRESALKGYDIAETGLEPRYPKGHACSPLTSLYASWLDVDGTRRDERHSGVDGGRVGEPIYAPGPGIVRAAWKADWGWGDEGALLILHSAQELNLDEGVAHYYSAFYHLSYAEVKSYSEGQPIKRGQLLAHVSRPGGERDYLPEVHWEVYEVRSDDAIKWHKNEFERLYWTNRTAKLVDPLYMLSREPGTLDGSKVDLVPFRKGHDYRAFRGFTYILPCTKQK